MFNKYAELLRSLSKAPLERLAAKIAEALYARRKRDRETSAAGEVEASISIIRKTGDDPRSEARMEDFVSMSDCADGIARIMNLWSERERGILLMDEVDMLLHPLRSELNFPIGEKYPLSPSGIRWNLPIYIADVMLKGAARVGGGGGGGGGGGNDPAASALRVSSSVPLVCQKGRRCTPTRNLRISSQHDRRRPRTRLPPRPPAPPLSLPRRRLTKSTRPRMTGSVPRIQPRPCGTLHRFTQCLRRGSETSE